MHCNAVILYQKTKYLYSQEIVALLTLKPGLKVLDVGCGIGGSGFYMVKVRINYYRMTRTAPRALSLQNY